MTKTKTTKWTDQPYNPDKVDGERMLALSGRILKKMLKAGKIWRDIDYDDTARKLAKQNNWDWDPATQKIFPSPGYADLRDAFSDRNLPDWMREPAREVLDDLLGSYEQACFMDPFDLNVARIIIACEELDNDCASIGTHDYTNQEVAEIFAQFLTVTSEAMPVIIPGTWLGSILIGPALTAEELAR